MATPYTSREGKRAARQADRCAGGGGWKKRMPSCNGVDRGCAHEQHDPTRKRADVHLVLHHQRPWPTSIGEKADDGSGDSDWCTLRPDDGPEAPSAYGEGGAPWHHRVPQGAFARLELLEGKLSRAVLRGLGGSNPAWLPGIGETCRKVTRPDPTQCSFLPPENRVQYPHFSASTRGFCHGLPSLFFPVGADSPGVAVRHAPVGVAQRPRCRVPAARAPTPPAKAQ